MTYTLFDVDLTRRALADMADELAAMHAAVEHALAARLAHRLLRRAALDLELGAAAIARARHHRLARLTRSRVTQLHALVLALERVAGVGGGRLVRLRGLVAELLVEPVLGRGRYRLAAHLAARVRQLLLLALASECRRRVLRSTVVVVDAVELSVEYGLAAEARVLVRHLIRQNIFKIAISSQQVYFSKCSFLIKNG